MRALSVPPGNDVLIFVVGLIGLVAGGYLDRWLGTAPWLALAASTVAIAAGFVNFFRR